MAGPRPPPPVYATAGGKGGLATVLGRLSAETVDVPVFCGRRRLSGPLLFARLREVAKATTAQGVGVDVVARPPPSFAPRPDTRAVGTVPFRLRCRTVPSGRPAPSAPATVAGRYGRPT